MPDNGIIPNFRRRQPDWVPNPPAVDNAAPQALRNIRDAAFEALFKDFKPTISGKRGEDLFQLILSGIREIYDIEAVIAGGAVRDFATGITDYKDVDVFIPMTWKDFNQSVVELGWQGDVIKVKDKHNEYLQIKTNPNEGCMFPTTARASSRVQNVQVDLVFIEKPLTVLDVATFPVHAQRCVWTLEGGLSVSPEAQKDIDNKTFTIDPTITDKEKLVKVVEKIEGWRKREGYKDWTIIQPEAKEWWETNGQPA